MKKPNNVLVVCHANKWRSPYICEVLKNRNPEINFRSAGMSDSCENSVAAKPMRLMAMEKYGVDLSQHRARVISKEDVEWADIILLMDNGNRKRFNDKFPDHTDKISMLGEYAGLSKISDPTFMSPASRSIRFLNCIDEIHSAIVSFENMEIDE